MKSKLPAIKLPDSPALVSVVQNILATLAPPEELTLSQWADKYRILTKEGSAEPGQWRTDRAEYQRGIMDAFTDPDVEEVIFMASAQVGKTDIMLNALGYVMDHDPGPTMFMQSTDKLAADFSTDRIEPMIEACPKLSEKFEGAWSKDTGNKILHKKFPGGYLFLTGAKEARNLRSKPIKNIFQDEIDSFDGDVGGEGDPCDLADERAKTFVGTRKKWKSSTPKKNNESRIQKAYEASDKRKYHLPCPHCGGFQVLDFRNGMKWPKDENGKHQPELAYYVCAHCGEAIQEQHRPDMLLAGQWIAEAPFEGIAGFWINELYSPWSSWADIAARFLKVKNDPDRLKTFINTCLGEPWVEDEEAVEAESLLSHRMHYGAQVPKEVLVLTAGVDVQKDRIEVEIKGWGVGKESWSIDYRILYGSPEESYVWNQLDLLWQEQFQHETGAKMIIDAACVDSGNWTSFVYDYCRNKKARRIFCIKGADGEGRPMVAAPSPKKTGKNRRPVDLYILGVDGIKGLLYERMKKHNPGPGYMHFPAHYQEDYFKGLTGEVIHFKYERGHQRRVWKKIRRNEPLDCNAYAVAALEILNPPLETMARLHAETGKFRAETVVRERKIQSIGRRGYA